jgi:hypothetical protein
MKKVGAWGRQVLGGRVACSASVVFGLLCESGNECEKWSLAVVDHSHNNNDDKRYARRDSENEWWLKCPFE